MFLKKKSVLVIVFSLAFLFLPSSYALAIPALVVGDIEALVPLTYTSYLEGYPVLFFTDHLDSEQIMKILEKSGTVIFANETFYNLMMDTLDSQYRYGLSDQAKSTSFTTEIEGVYEIWAKKGKKEKSEERALKVFIDDKEVALGGDRQQGRRWISLGKMELAKKKHTIRVTGSIEELLIVPEEEVEKHRLKIEKLINRHNLDIGHLFWSEKSELTEKSIYLPRESRYRVMVKQRVNPIQFKNIGLSLKMGSGQEIKKWSFSSANVDYNYFITKPGTLVLTSYFDGDISEKEFVEMKREDIKLDLKEYPYFDLAYKLEDPNLQKIEVIFGIDFDGDGAVDGYFGTDKSKENITLHKFNLYHAVKVEFPGKSHYSLTELKLLAGKIEGVDCSKPERKGIYTWEFRDIQLYSTEAGLVPEWITDFERMRAGIDSVRVKNLGLNLKVCLAKELKKWSFKSSGMAYEYSVAEGELLEFSIRLDGDSNEQEFVEIRRKDLKLDLEKYPYLGLTYKLQDPSLQVIDVVLGVDFDGEGMVDEYIPLRKKAALKNWKKIGAANETMDFYEIRLPADWPLFLNTRYSWEDKFRVYKNGISMEPTWYRWDDNKELVEVGRDGYNRLVISIPKNEVPQDSVYTVSYLPLAIKNQIFPGLDRIQINVEQLVKERFPDKKDYFLTELRLIFGKAEGVDCSEPETRGRYTYQIKNIDFEQYSSSVVGISVDEGDFKKKSLKLDARSTEYSYFITDNGALSFNTYFDGGISPSSKDTKIRETEDEYVKLTVPDLDLDINEYPFLDITYKLQHPEVQHIDGELDIDLTGDGKVDKSISLRKEKELILGNWREFPWSNEKMDLYETGLPEEWPKTYTSQYSSPDRFTVYKNGIPMQTNWHRWGDEREWVEMDGPWKRVIIAVRKGESPNDSVYKAKFRYLPSVKRSEIFAGFDRLHIDIKEGLEETFGQQANPRLLNLHLYLKKAKDIDCSSPDKRRVYSFEIRDINVYRYVTPEEMLSSKNRWFRKMPLFRIAGKSYSGEDVDKITVEFESDILWYEIEDLGLGPGNYRFSPVMQEGFETNLALIEPVSVSRSTRSPGKGTQVEFSKINPTRYRVQVKTRKPFWLVFSESFHPGWKAYIRKSPRTSGQRIDFEWSAVLSALRDWGKRVELKEHYLVNGYANAWWVPIEELTTTSPKRKYQTMRSPDDSNQPGMKEFEIILEFKPQRLFEIGVVISLATFLGCVGYLIRGFVRKRKRKIRETGG